MPIVPSNDLRIFVLNVGQADTSVIITPQGKVLIIDAYRAAKLVNLLQGLGPFVVRHGTPQVGDNTPLRNIVLRKAVFY